MSMTINKELPNPAALKAKFPLPEELRSIKAERDAEIAKVFRGESDKFLVIIGPCSADNEDTVCEYTGRLARVNEQVKDKLIIIPRIYTNKPRTTGEGYKGMLHQPDPDKAPDLLGGIIATLGVVFPSIVIILVVAWNCSKVPFLDVRVNSRNFIC